MFSFVLSCSSLTWPLSCFHHLESCTLHCCTFVGSLMAPQPCTDILSLTHTFLHPFVCLFNTRAFCTCARLLGRGPAVYIGMCMFVFVHECVHGIFASSCMSCILKWVDVKNHTPLPYTEVKVPWTFASSLRPRSRRFL